jgi:hypothetical protein
MTIRRQYQLPNCSLILDGLNIDPTPGNEDVMSLLVNAECRISGLERSLNGSYNFFSALVRAVSQYSQEVLSGFAHPQVVEGEPLLVHINPGEGPYHHLVVQPEIADLGESGDGRAIDIKLSDVQLYDLSEAVDQFFDDTQTLPELSASLSPLPRRFIRTDEPLSDRALPAILGFGSLVAATMALSLLPLPQMREPAVEGRSTNGSADVKTADATDPKAPTGEAAGNGSTAPIDGIAAANTDSALWDKAPKITDESTLASLQSDLKAQIDEAIDPKVSFSDPLAYQVAVNEAGEVVGYQFENDAALRDVDKTPLPRLARASAAAENLEDNAIAQYAVAFNAEGVAVTPSDGNTAVAALPDKPAADPKAAAETEGEKVETEPKEKDADAETTVAATNSTSASFTDEPPVTLNSLTDVELLNEQLKNTIVENRNQPRVGEAAAIYRVRVKEDGTVIGYQPISQEATDAVENTPLPDLLKSAPEETPAVDYRVAFTERGVVEVSPWWGWSFYE